MAKVPIIPNQYLYNQLNYNLGLLKSSESDTLLLITDNDAFLEKYREYYEDRFQVEEQDDSFVVPSDFEVVYGLVTFDNEEEPAEEDEELEDEKAE